jgi:uncharacterized protein (DUF952 family)
MHNGAEEKRLIVHICPRAEWHSALQAGVYRPKSLEIEGFIHCSRPEQVKRVAERFFRDVPDLVLLWIEPERLQGDLRWESADGEVFPHIYTPINLNAVIRVSELDLEMPG